METDMEMETNMEPETDVETETENTQTRTWTWICGNFAKYLIRRNSPYCADRLWHITAQFPTELYTFHMSQNGQNQLQFSAPLPIREFYRIIPLSA
jgi:hypothetical protein